MKLHYSPGSCALGIHALLEDIGAPYTLARVDFSADAQNSPAYRAINPKGKVPALQLDDGSVLTEFQAIALYLARLRPDLGLIPSAPLAEARMWEAVHYIVGTIHQDGFRRVFRPYRFASREEDHAAVRAQGQALVATGFDWIESRLQGQDWLAGDYSLADFALFYASWWNIVRCGFPTPAGVAAHYARMRARPGPAKALADEGLSG